MITGYICVCDQLPLGTLDSKVQGTFAQQGLLEYDPEVCETAVT